MLKVYIALKKQWVNSQKNYWLRTINTSFYIWLRKFLNCLRLGSILETIAIYLPCSYALPYGSPARNRFYSRWSDLVLATFRMINY